MRTEEAEKIINKFLTEKIPSITGIYLFGSYAVELATSASDIDIAILTNENLPAVHKWNIQEELASILDKDVDLVDLKDASVILRVEVIDNGRRIFTGNHYECDNFETTTYSMYADLNEIRMDILNDIKTSYGRNPPK
jgi:uncharacterized protein